MDGYEAGRNHPMHPDNAEHSEFDWELFNSLPDIEAPFDVLEKKKADTKSDK